MDRGVPTVAGFHSGREVGQFPDAELAFQHGARGVETGHAVYPAAGRGRRGTQVGLRNRCAPWIHPRGWPEQGAKHVVSADADVAAYVVGIVQVQAGEGWLCDRGNPGMAVAGMGDVLTGVIAGIAAQCGDLALAARAGVFVHSCAGDRAAMTGERGMLATEVIEQVRACVNPR